MNNVIAIVGRPNVGKSSLFNKLLGKRESIVHDEPGVTRDRLYADIDWTGHALKVIDTGGIELEDRPFQEQIKVQAKIAIEEATVIVFVVDGVEGLSMDDEFIANILRKSGKKVVIAANKLEGNRDMDPSVWALGLGDIFEISAVHGEGVGDLLDEVVRSIDFSKIEVPKHTRISIIGRPNAGKSSLLNALAKEERSIVSEISGTTRDSVNTDIKIGEDTFTIVDTAGINRKSKLIESVDHYALSRAMNSIRDSDITILMIDYDRELAHFDAVVGGYAFEKNKPIIIVINKWDLAKKETMTMKNKEDEVRKNFKYMSWAPMIFISALTGLRLDKLKEKILTIAENKTKMIKTALLNEVISEIQMAQPAQTFNGGRLNIKFVRMVEGDVPTFIFWINNKKYLHFSYQRFLENKLREYFGFEGVPIKMAFRATKGKQYEETKR